MILTLYLIDLIQHLSRGKKHKKTRKRLLKIGTKVGFTGETGIGKTTCASGAITFFETHIIDLTKQKMEYVQTIMSDYDFVYLNHFIDTMCLYNPDAKPEVLFDLSISAIQEQLYKRDEHRYYFDGIKVHTYETLMMDYIEARVAYNRKNYVFSNIDYESLITGAKNYDLDGSDTKFKERWYGNDFRLRRYSATFFDEETLDPDKVNTNWQQIAQAESGAMEFLRLHRQLFKETSWYIATLQHGGRMVKTQRELFNSIVHIVKRKRLSEFKVIKFLYKCLTVLNETSHKLYKLVTRNSDKLASRKTLYKKRKKFLLHILDMLNAKDFLAYKVEIYQDTDKEATHSASRIETTFVFPITWCFSPVNSWDFAYQYDEAVKRSNVSPVVKQRDTYLETGRYLRQRKKEKEEKEATRTSKKQNKDLVRGGA